MDTVKQFLKVPGCHVFERSRETITKARDELLETSDLEDVRRLVYPIERRRGLLVEIGGNRLVCEEHEFLDQPVRHVSFEGRDRLDASGVIDDDLRFVEIEVNRSSAPSRIIQGD